ncbi:hypothetical protein ACTXT7_006046 [Hymenolepis weldensis]
MKSLVGIFSKALDFANCVNMEAAPTSEEHEIVDTIEIDDHNIPILEYATVKLSSEVCRKLRFMWLNDSENKDSFFVHTPFGLFPMPYSRHLVPLEILKRFQILGISIAKVIQDGYLLDLPLSKP